MSSPYSYTPVSDLKISDLRFHYVNKLPLGGENRLHVAYKTCNNDKNLSEIQLEYEKEDEFVVVVVKEIVSRLLKEEEKLEWWFEQDIDKEEERFKEDEDGGE
ncbi:hypothetical protein Tco_0780286, partial [Tanacetum coccineum]